jgi:lipopolysaccharide export system protein LptA
VTVKNNHSIAFALILAGMIAGPLCPCQALAQQASSKMAGLELSNDKPIQIESDKLEIRQQENKAVFTGNVLVVQGTTTLRAGHMVVYYTGSGGSISSGNADIKTIDVSEKVYLESGEQQATADTGTFDMAAQTFVLKGDKVVLSEGANVFTGCQLTVLMETGEAQLESCGGRVQIQLDPKSQKAK